MNAFKLCFFTGDWCIRCWSTTSNCDFITGYWSICPGVITLSCGFYVKSWSSWLWLRRCNYSLFVAKFVTTSVFTSVCFHRTKGGLNFRHVRSFLARAAVLTFNLNHFIERLNHLSFTPDWLVYWLQGKKLLWLLLFNKDGLAYWL